MRPRPQDVQSASAEGETARENRPLIDLVHSTRLIHMSTVNIHEAKTQLSRLVERAASGETVIIARAGKPLVRVSALDAPAEPRRVGFLEGAFTVPVDFDTMSGDDIDALFGPVADRA